MLFVTSFTPLSMLFNSILFVCIRDFLYKGDSFRCSKFYLFSVTWNHGKFNTSLSWVLFLLPFMYYTHIRQALVSIKLKRRGSLKSWSKMLCFKLFTVFLLETKWLSDMASKYLKEESKKLITHFGIACQYVCVCGAFDWAYFQSKFRLLVFPRTYFVLLQPEDGTTTTIKRREKKETKTSSSKQKKSTK